jgi:hypothetical protein|tara:strand:- start:79 stop:1575 length:1497 start_codon:yes stop_codon:yes gene_type:complete
MPFGNLANMLSDIDFWGGVAKGANIGITEQEDRKDKDIRELRNFGITRGMQIEEDNRDAINAAEVQVKELASLVSGDRSATSPEAMEAAFYLINQEGGIAGANRVAQSLYTEYNTYGTDPILKMGLSTRTEGAAPTPRAIAKTFTRLKPLPDVSASGISSRQTALDVIFGTPTAEEQVSQEMAQMFSTDTDTVADITPVSATGVDEKLILGTNVNSELKRMKALLNKHNRVAVDKRDDQWTNTENMIKQNIDMLEIAADKDLQITYTTRISLEGKYLNTLLSASGLKGEWKDGEYIPQGVQANVMEVAESAVARMGTLVQLAVNNGYKGRLPGSDEEIDPLEFVKKYGAAQGYRIILDEGDPPNEIAPFLTIDMSDNGKIFNKAVRETEGWEQSIIQDGKPPPDITLDSSATSSSSAAPATGSASSTYSGTSISPEAIAKVKDERLNISVRMANGRAILAALTALMPDTPEEVLPEFERLTGMTYRELLALGGITGSN